MQALRASRDRRSRDRDERAALEAAVSPPDVAPRLIASSGLVVGASALAFDAHQSLLSVGTSNGRVKVIGQDGVEALLCSPRRSPTRQVLTTPHGAILRLADDGTIELWSLPEEAMLSLIDETWRVECLAAIEGTPFIAMGTHEGSLRVLRIEVGPDDCPEEAIK